tara:strand:- start:1159 stop:1299 length:141 start_codon:yes stop_codon:yes gene_type:complete
MKKGRIIPRIKKEKGESFWVSVINLTLSYASLGQMDFFSAEYKVSD